jgi:heat shock protein HslJ
MAILAVALGACAQQPAPTPEPQPTPMPEPADMEPQGVEKTLYVGHKLVDCVGVGPQKCMLVKESPDAEYMMFYDSIEGFEYEEGYEYIIRVMVEEVEDPPADASSLKYTLVEVLDKQPVAEQTLFIGPYLVECEGEGSMVCMLVKERPEDDYGLFYDPIQGFDYAEGYEYELLVRIDSVENPPAGGSSLRYTLLELVQQKPSLEGRDWTVTAYANAEGQETQVLPGTELTVSFRDGNLNGNAGCNGFFGGYQISDGMLMIGEAVGMTAMACPDDISAQERDFMTALLSSASFEVLDTEASLLNGNGDPVVWLAMPGAGIEGREWQLESYVDAEGQEQAVLQGTEITALFAEGQVAGSAGCNNYFGGYTLAGSQLSIDGPLGTTRMLCPEPEGVMEQEQAYLAALGQTSSYELGDAKLVLLNADGNPVATYGEQGPELEGRTWVLESYLDATGETVAPLDNAEVATLTFADGQINGTTGCNSFFGTYTASGGQIQVDEAMGMTQMMCTAELFAQEEAIVAAISGAANYRVVEGRLEIMDSDGNVTATYVEQGPGLEDNPWELVEVLSSAGEQMTVLPGTEVTAEFVAGALGGSGGCNRYFGPYEVSGSSLTVGMLGSTMMFCGEPEGVMDQEQAFLDAMQSAASFEVSAEQLLILNGDGQVVLSFRALEPVSLTGADWLVLSYNNGKGGMQSPYAGTEITAKFAEDGSLGGSTGCNDYSTSYMVDGNSIQIAETMALTMKMCSEPEGIMDQEQAFLAALGASATFAIQGDQMEMRDAEGARTVTMIAAQ